VKNIFSSKETLKQILIISGIFTVFIFSILNLINIHLITDTAPSGIISFEFAKDIDKSISIISSWNLDAKINAGLSLGIDFLFLIVYSIFFSTACYLIAQIYIKRITFLYKFGLVIAQLQFIAGLFDAIENVALIKLLLGSQNELYSPIAYYFASIKFAIIAIGIIYVIIGLITSLSHKTTSSK